MGFDFYWGALSVFVQAGEALMLPRRERALQAAAGHFADAVLAVVCALAMGGAVFRLFFWRDPGTLGFVIYLVLGRLSLLLLWPLATTLPLGVTVLVGAGGVLYTAGVVFFALTSLSFSTDIWHGYVLAASGCFFAAIAVAVIAMT